jgi:bifunctional UDP-N-acetylglucosamine pyrophosphorylase/glucosamine-1-phosphate N-acetyltransferase
MNNQSLQAVVLAAGESSRFWPLNSKHKSLLRVMGKPLIWYTINDLKNSGIKEIIVLQGPDRDVEKELKDLPFCVENIKYIVQPEAKGIGNALLCAKDLLRGQFAVIWAHQVNCGHNVDAMVAKSKSSGAKLVVLGQPTKTPWLYGIGRIEGDKIFEIVEKPAEGQEPSNIRIFGWLLEEKLIPYLERSADAKYDFETALSLYMKENDARVTVVPETQENLSMKYPWHLFKVQKYLFDHFLTKKTIAKTAQVAKNATIEGNVVIGENVKVYEGTVIKGPCYIGENSVIGNNSIVRDYCDIEADSVVGALCEMARTIVQSDVHVHSGFFGDSILDRGVRVGAGAIVTNVRIDREEVSAIIKKEKDGVKALAEVKTGMRSLGTIIGQNSKIGARTTFMPGRFIGKNCLIGPAEVLMHSVEDGAKI